MKKLMIVGAAALCATVGFGAVESSNTVGFHDKDIENYEFIGPSFTKTGGSEAFTYGEIAVNCDETGEAADTGWQAMTDYIVMLNQNGTYVRKLIYAPQYVAADIGITKGWYDNDDDQFATCWNNLVTYAPGEGFQMCATAGANATVTIKSALATE